MKGKKQKKILFLVNSVCTFKVFFMFSIYNQAFEFTQLSNFQLSEAVIILSAMLGWRRSVLMTIFWRRYMLVLRHFGLECFGTKPFGADVLAPPFWRRVASVLTFWRRCVVAQRRVGTNVLTQRRFGAEVLALIHFGTSIFWRRIF